ncbi:MAG: hypothetical protein H6739_20875 [Alphaproteobacteria bacterium]|nr:hypothetical protein [Alphaproteobacteria bacterium]
MLQLPEAWTGVAPDGSCEQPAEVAEVSTAQQLGQAAGGAWNAVEGAAGDFVNTATDQSAELWAWLFGEDAGPDLGECAGPEVELETLFTSERLNAQQIAEARTLIAQLPEADQGAWYEQLQGKVPYHNQRNNESPNEGESGGTCNLTALAMCLEYLGVANPRPEMQFEDALDQLRIEQNLGPLASWNTWNLLAQHLGKRIEFRDAGKHDQAWFESTLKGWLQGDGVLCSIAGHVVRIQGMNEDGLVVDDPYGLSILRPRSNGKPYSWAPKGRNGYKEHGVDGTHETNLGEDMVWPWADVVKYNFPTFGVVK